MDMKKKLLVADDSLTIQKVIRLALSNEGYDIQAVSDGNDAVQQISLFRPDIVLIDVSLPGKTALEVKREVNQHEDLEEVRFVLMSSAFEKVDEAGIHQVKFHGRLTKPFDPAHLRQVLQESLAQVTAKRSEQTSLLHKTPAPAAPVAPVTQARKEKTNPGIPALPTSRPGQVAAAAPAKAAANTPTAKTPPPVPTLQDEFEAATPPLLDLSAHLTPPPPASAQMPTEAEMAAAERSDDDIRHLTESTIKMSGLDDFQWSVNEPSMKPTPRMSDNGGTNFELDLRESNDSLPPPVPAPEKTQSPLHPHQMPTAEAPMNAHAHRHHPAAPAAHAEKNLNVSQAELDEIVRREVQKLLPEVAERILKEEIHRMLNEKS